MMALISSDCGVMQAWKYSVALDVVGRVVEVLSGARGGRASATART